MPVLDVASPLVPSVYESLLIIAGIIQFVLFFALLFWLPRQSTIGPVSRILGLLVAFLLPILGPLAVWWSVRGRKGPAS